MIRRKIKQNDYCIGIIDNSSNSKVLQMTIMYMRMMLWANTIISKSIDDILDKACKTEAKYCIIVSAGLFIKDMQILYDLDDLCQKPFYVYGHILAYNNTYELHPQTILVNLQIHRKFSQPRLIKINNTNIQRSVENIHDDYTPLWIKQKESTSNQETDLINIALTNGYTIYNFSSNIRYKKVYMYDNPDKIQTYFNSLETPNHKDAFYPWNTEQYSDITKLDTFTINKIYGVAAGFKVNFILNKFSYFSNTEVIYFDYSKNALAIKAAMLKYWDGHDYISFITDIARTYSFRIAPQTATLTTVRWKQEMDEWGGEANFVKHWQDYKTLKHKYVYIDILNSTHSFITPDSNSFIWWSNCFHTVHAHLQYSLPVLETKYENWITMLRNTNANIFALGRDYLNGPVESTISKYVLDKQSKIQWN